MKMVFNFVEGGMGHIENNKELNQSKENVKERRIWQSQEIFGQAKMVMIQHHDLVYRLLITRQGKLILTK